MKNFLFSIAAMAMLISCGSKDNNDPTPPTPPNNTTTPQIKEVSFSFINWKFNFNSRSFDTDEDFLNDEQLNHFYFSLNDLKIGYQYDAQGRITSLTFTQKHLNSVQTATIQYTANSMENSLKTYPLNADGNITGTNFSYNDKKQLLHDEDAQYTWENDNCVSGSFDFYKKTDYNLSYTSHPNKNNFLVGLLNVEEIGNYRDYFMSQIVFRKGKATKNLLQQVTSKVNDLPSDFIDKYSYTFNTDGTVKTIFQETIESGRSTIGLGLIPSSKYTEKWNSLQTLIQNIQNGTEKRYTYKEVLKTNDRYVFRITSQSKVLKDKDNKPINLLVDKVIQYDITFKEESGQQVIDKFNEKCTYNIHQNITYQLNY